MDAADVEILKIMFNLDNGAYISKGKFAMNRHDNFELTIILSIYPFCDKQINQNKELLKSLKLT